ncbi:MAG: ABC transporter permease [Phycisphaerae bacterium]
MNGLWAILLKEFSHIQREPMTLFFALVIPVAQLTIFGYAIDTKIEHIRTVVLDLDGRESARELVESFANTRTFRIVEHATSDDAFEHALRAGRARVGLRIPPDYSEQLQSGRQAVVQVLIDGSDSQAAITALNSSALLGLNQSMRRGRIFAEARQLAAARDPFGRMALAVQMRPRLMYNPDLLSAYFFVPALVGIIMQNVTLFLTSFAIVREREAGTLEQLFVTPAGRGALLLGKLIPYAVLGFLETLIVLLVMVFLFGVPIAGNLVLLLTLSLLFLVTALGLGLLVSTVAKTQLQAIQVAFMILLPSVLLSGFIFPRENMPLPIYWLSFAIPVTYFLEMLRGVILRGAGLRDLIEHVVGLAVCCTIVMSLAVLRFRKQLD